jgi:hypothetical protein
MILIESTLFRTFLTLDLSCVEFSTENITPINFHKIFNCFIRMSGIFKGVVNYGQYQEFLEFLNSIGNFQVVCNFNCQET